MLHDNSCCNTINKANFLPQLLFLHCWLVLPLSPLVVLLSDTVILPEKMLQCHHHCAHNAPCTAGDAVCCCFVLQSSAHSIYLKHTTICYLNGIPPKGFSQRWNVPSSYTIAKAEAILATEPSTSCFIRASSNAGNF